MILIALLLVFTDIRIAWDPPRAPREPVLIYQVLIAPEGMPFPFGWQVLLETTNTAAVFLSYPLTNRMEITVRAVYQNFGPSRPSNFITIDPELYGPENLRFDYPAQNQR